MMIKLLICCIYVVVYQQNFVDGLKSNLQIAETDHTDTLKVNYRLESKKVNYDGDEIETKMKNIVDTRDALNKLSYEIRGVDESRLGGVVQARNRIRRSVQAIMMQNTGRRQRPGTKNQG
ncbi:hypothetical protein SNE40_008699 [Patella caerulea]|uniref:Uncharacterized protein n=1 Tax=Patella caerulea TaxID=87958 RepID=A0AAN8JQI8_PATCE